MIFKCKYVSEDIYVCISSETPRMTKKKNLWFWVQERCNRQNVQPDGISR